MSYRVGIGPRLAGKMGVEPGGPMIICDGCGKKLPIQTLTSLAPKWFLDGKPPRGWRGIRMNDGSKRWDLCPLCWRGER